jgi:two-component system LytT family sensor kinase
MLIGILVKTLFAAAVWFWVLRSFKRNGQLWLMMAKLLLMMAVCLTIEVMLSWQFAAFHLSHIVSHSSPVIWVNLATYLAITMIMLAIVFTRLWISNERRQRELVETNLTTELAYLRSQIHPHFLFNTLNNIFSIAQRDHNPEIATSISSLSRLMRYILDEGHNKFVPLKNEIDHLSDFIKLASMRYSPNEIDIRFSTAGNVDDAVIAPMLLLPFVENAFKHGVKIGEHSVINIEITASKEKVVFHCQNPVYKAQRPSDESSGIGLVNVKRRVELLYTGRSKLQIIDTETLHTVDLELEL